MIEKYVLASVSCVIPLDPLRRAIDHFGLPQEWKNPYRFAFKAIVDVTAQNTKELGFSEPIDFIFDERSEKNEIRQGWEIYLATCRPDLLKYVGDEPVFENDMNTMPLQAADLFAWWVRKCWVANRTIHPDAMKYKWEKRKKIPRLFYQPDEKAIFEEMEQTARFVESIRLTSPRTVTVFFGKKEIVLTATINGQQRMGIRRLFSVKRLFPPQEAEERKLLLHCQSLYRVAALSKRIKRNR